MKRCSGQALAELAKPVKMLDLCGQAVYKAHGISAALATEDGEQQIMRRLQVLDMARRMLNTVVIDAEGESYDFLALELAGRGEIAEIALRYLAAVSRIPPEILYNYRSPPLVAQKQSRRNGKQL